MAMSNSQRASRPKAKKQAPQSEVGLQVAQASQVLDGRFELLQEIGRGGRGVVYLVADLAESGRTKALKLRYICRLFAKELVYKNFPGLPPDELLERMIELTLRTEENLR